MTRIAIQDFSLANPLYIGKTLSFYTVDANGAKTSTLATLYSGPTGTDLLENPQELDSEGKTRTPVYIEDPVIGVVTGLAAGDTETGIIPITGRNRGTWQTGAVYYPTEIFQNKEGGDKDGNWYVASKTHTAGVFDDDLGGGLFSLMLDVHQIANDFVIPPVQALTDQAKTYRDEAQTAAQNTYSVFKYTATGGETALSGPDDNANTLAYVPGVIIVEMNGAILEDGADFTATNGTSITDIAALSASDVVTIRAFGSFSVTAEMDAIVAEGASQVANVQAEGTTQITAVQTEGATQVAAVQAEGTTQTANMQTYAQQMADIVNNTYDGAFFEMDGNGDVMPTLSPVYSETYELDGNGDIQPL